jgi:hypothetical protein
MLKKASREHKLKQYQRLIEFYQELHKLDLVIEYQRKIKKLEDEEI